MRLAPTTGEYLALLLFVAVCAAVVGGLAVWLLI
ncbi:hypothetical protein SAMN05216258_1298 [Albimonas pacifica]|uniref:Uncharacterized protein n=1 Tax=Albimonas pacifica TaxID=1114924 RepID=A0A1I3Q5M1_9RHOB|nr:hypothetical protein SAMN05216258_1298 [Albimonas pacifica]